MDKLISQQAAIDTLNDGAELLRRVLDDADVVGVERAKYEWGLGLIESFISDMEELPSIQPKGTRLSTVCLLCKKPAVTFNTEDDIPYTNYSYCEDCLRKGLKLLREQKKNLQAQPERKTGRWLPDNTDYYRTKFICSVCGESEEVPTTGFGYGTMWDYCPMCGAKMERRQDGH